MPYYNDLRHDDDPLRRGYELVFPDMTLVERRRTLRNLLVLREGLSDRVRPRQDLAGPPVER